MRTTTSLATVVALMAVAGSAAPVGASGRALARGHDQQRARNVVPENNTKPAHVGIPDPMCGDCRDETLKKVVLDGAKPVVDTVKDVLDVDGKGGKGGKGGKSGDGLPPIHASVDIGNNEHKTHDEQPHDGKSHDNEHGGESQGKPEHTKEIDVDVKADVSKDHVDVKANISKDHVDVDANVSVNLSKGCKSEAPCPDDTKKDVKDGMHDIKDGVHDVKDGVHDVKDGVHDVKDGVKDVKDGAKNAHDQVTKGATKVVADLHDTPERVLGAGKGVGEQVIGKQPVGKKPKSDNPEDCEDFVAVDSHDGKIVVSRSVVRR